jgi:hypothetical protein
MADFKEVTIKLTDDQRNQIKSAIGQDISEVKVSADRGNPLAATSLTDRANPLMAELAERANPSLGGGKLDDRANPSLGGGKLDDRANPSLGGGKLDDRANPSLGEALTDRANPISLMDRANPTSVIE